MNIALNTKPFNPDANLLSCGGSTRSHAFDMAERLAPGEAILVATLTRNETSRDVPNIAGSLNRSFPDRKYARRIRHKSVYVFRIK